MTGRLEPTYPRWKRNMFRYFVSVPIIAACLFFVFIVMILSFQIQVTPKSLNPRDNNSSIKILFRDPTPQLGQVLKLEARSSAGLFKASGQRNAKRALPELRVWKHARGRACDQLSALHGEKASGPEPETLFLHQRATPGEISWKNDRRGFWRSKSVEGGPDGPRSIYHYVEVG